MIFAGVQSTSQLHSSRTKCSSSRLPCDSSVVAALLHKAIGDQLTCVFVDNGLLRKNEGDMVMDMFAKNMGVKVIRADAEDLFLGRLAGVDEPEAKRKIIGNTFIEVFDDEATRLENVPFLAQGTIYPDVIESAASSTGKAHVIKSHHNVGGLPEDMKMSLVEPLRELFKDEVRKIGLELGLPYDMVYRHPFPGPGLGVRILGEVKKEYAEILREADDIFISELHKADWYHVFDLVDDAVGDFLQQLIRQVRPACSHEVDGFYRTQCDHPLITTGIAHHTDRLLWDEHGEGLTS